MDYNIPSGGYSREEKSAFLEFQLFCYRYKKLIKISYVGLYKIYDWPKFEGHNSLNKTATPLEFQNWNWRGRLNFWATNSKFLEKCIKPFFFGFQSLFRLRSAQNQMRATSQATFSHGGSARLLNGWLSKGLLWHPQGLD